MVTQRFRLGVLSGALILALLVLAPPIVASYLEGWQFANTRLSTNPELVNLCGPDFEVQMSRWLYTYEISGDNGDANFKGRAVGERCQTDFTTVLVRRRGEWQVHSLVLKP
jgi:hypothetical protein